MSWKITKSAYNPLMYWVTFWLDPSNCVTEAASPFYTHEPMYYAVVDDFGNLVLVERV